MTQKGQILLLAICVPLLLKPGDALQCRDCTRTADGCLGVEGTDQSCTADPELETCNIAQAYENGEVIWIYVGCGPREACNTKLQVTKHIHVEFGCCEGIDFCNDGL